MAGLRLSADCPILAENHRKLPFGTRPRGGHSPLEHAPFPGAISLANDALGRKPVPTHIKAITGNPGKRALNAAEPVPPFEIPTCPPELNARAKQEWDRLAELLGALRLLTPLDRAALAAYCAAYGLWAQAITEVETYGAMVKSPTGFPIQSPWLAIANRQSEIMIRIASEFGFTPASRARIVARKDEQGELFGTREVK